MPYIPITPDDRRVMLEKIGVKNLEELLKPIPENLRLKESLKLPPALSELELLSEIKKLSELNKSNLTIFAGGGVYDHFIPAALGAIVFRPEFVTAYTPYQAEVSQGTLQVIYEFQTHICRLTGMDIANASMYDGASATAEAASLAMAKTGRSKIVVSETVNPLFRNLIGTYLSGRNVEIITAPSQDGTTDFNRLHELVDDKTACVITAQPNFFGLLEDIEKAGDLIHKAGGLLVTAIDPISVALIKTPAGCGADIVVGEGQPLGIPLSFGGPLLGFFAVKKDLVRTMPGRLAAMTEDVDGKPGFTLTLQTREQHIRRDKATSNICTNQALCATMATVYLSLMGKCGLKSVALLAMEKTHKIAEMASRLKGYRPYFKGDFIREFALKTPVPASQIIDDLIEKHSILPGIDLGRFYPGMDDCLLIAATEKRTTEEILALIAALGEY
ncbi:MAG: aminomethyl-transferring glycine dehydrogenase subunit GcvPA [Candidatus Zixiibacteriota bacterium]